MYLGRERWKGERGGEEREGGGKGERRGREERYTLQYKLPYYSVYESKVTRHHIVEVISYEYSAHEHFNLVRRFGVLREHILRGRLEGEVVGRKRGEEEGRGEEEKEGRKERSRETKEKGRIM